jgi:prolipoprotein diacylglyceryltransferase
VDAKQRIGSYFALGAVGTLAGAALVCMIAIARNLPPMLPVVLTVTAVATLFASVKVTQLVVGYERIVLYELFLLALAAAGVALELTGLPVRSGLDLAAIGIGTMLIFGRIGCLRVGCCHGRPAEWGIVYGDEHAREGFPTHYVGVRLFGVQLIESAVTALLVVLSVLIFLAFVPGQALCFYASTYGVSRFGLELLRGDDERPIFAGASEAQWLALATSCAALVAACAWSLPLVWIHVGVAVTLVVATSALVVANRALRYRTWWFRDARRMKEFAEALQSLLRHAGSTVTLVETPGGLRVSCSRDASALLLVLSCSHRALSPSTARFLARDARRLSGLDFTDPNEGRTHGMFHFRTTTGWSALK